MSQTSEWIQPFVAIAVAVFGGIYYFLRSVPGHWLPPRRTLGPLLPSASRSCWSSTP